MAHGMAVVAALGTGGLSSLYRKTAGGLTQLSLEWPFTQRPSGLKTGSPL